MGRPRKKITGKIFTLYEVTHSVPWSSTVIKTTNVTAEDYAHVQRIMGDIKHVSALDIQNIRRTSIEVLVHLYDPILPAKKR